MNKRNKIQTPTFRIATEYHLKSSRKSTPPIISSVFADRKTDMRRWVTTQLDPVCLSCTCMILMFEKLVECTIHCWRIPKQPLYTKVSNGTLHVHCQSTDQKPLWTQSEIYKLNLAWSASAISNMSDSQQESVTTNSVLVEFEQKIDNHCWTFGVGTKRIEVFA